MEIATIFIPLVFFDVDMMIVWDISRHYPYALLLITTVAHINYTAYNNYAIFFRGGWNIKTLRWSRTAQSKPRQATYNTHLRRTHSEQLNLLTTTQTSNSIAYWHLVLPPSAKKSTNTHTIITTSFTAALLLIAHFFLSLPFVRSHCASTRTQQAHANQGYKTKLIIIKR